MSSSNLTVISGISYFSTSSITSYVSNKTNHQKFSNLFIGDKNSQKISSNESCLTVEISDLVIFQGLPFNIAQKPWLRKVLDLARNVSIGCQPPNRNIISKNILDVIHDQNIQRKLVMIKKEADIFGLLFLCDDSTISITPLLKILVSGKIFLLLYQKLLIVRITQLMVG